MLNECNFGHVCKINKVISNGNTALELIRGHRIQISKVIIHSHKELVGSVKCRKWAIITVKKVIFS